MNPKLISNDLIKEEYFYMKHPSGLDIYVHPKKGYTSTYAVFGTNFGSINSQFKLEGETSFTCVPDGIAHYLEHKLFEGKEGDAFSLFAKTGASANAYTSFEKTAYLFSCAGNFEESLNILLKFVQSPYFTPENVEKERGIIAQEIKMYEDSPSWKLLINLLESLYENHPVRKDIAGSVESISQINSEILYKCYNTFYNLNNMALCVAGDVDPNTVFDIANKNLSYSKPLNVECFFPQESHDVFKSEVSQKFDIQSSMFSLGFKEDALSNKWCSMHELVCTDILMRCISSRTSDMYQELLKEQLINTASFSGEFFEGPGYASIIFSGESNNPKKAAEIIRKHTEIIHKNGIEKKIFERSKNAVYGSTLGAFNSISNIANLSLDFALAGRNIFDYVNILRDVSLDDVNSVLEKKLQNQYSALSVVEPK